MIDRILSKWFVPKVEVDTLYAHLSNLALSYQELLSRVLELESRCACASSKHIECHNQNVKWRPTPDKTTKKTKEKQ